jgi:hypothetical protein
MHRIPIAMISGLLGLVVLAVALAPVNSVRAQDEEPDPAALLDETAEAMLAIDSFHFAITTPVGKTMLEDGIELAGVQGDVVRPDIFQVTFTVDLGIASLDLEAIGIGSELWVANPLEGGNFIRIAGEGEEISIPPLALLNPDQLIRDAIALLRDPVYEGTEEIDGREVRVISGVFDPADLQVLGTPVSEQFLSGLEPLDVLLAIDDANRIVRAEFSGALLPSEQGAGRIVRRVDLSNFDEPVVITPPETAE